MKRLLLFFLGIFLISMSTSAGPAQPQLIKDTQPDGTVIEYYLRGDEKINWMESPDGHTLLLDNDGRIVYALKNSEGDIEPSDIIYKNTQLKKSFDPRINAIPQKLFYSTSQVNSMLQIWNIEKEQVKGRVLGTRPYTGEFRVLCVLVDFADNPMTTENVKSKFEMLLNQRGYTGTLGNPAYGSVKDYFWENSYGKVNITFDVVGPYRAEEMSNYRGAGVYKVTNLSKLGKFLIKNKIQNESELDLSLYADPSGEINRLHIIYAGEDQAFAGLANGFAWSHQYGFGMGGSLEPGNPDDYDCVSSKDGQTYTFKRYSCSAELSPNMRNRDEKKVSTIGTPTHELAHLLFESKDFYDGNGVYKGTGQWDLMAGGSHNYITDNFYTSMFYGNSPAHMNMYEKIRLGWVKPQVLTTSGSFSLENAAENPVAYIYQKGNNLTDFTSLENVQDDFFILENRQKKGFDAGLLNGPQYNGPLFQGGLLIYRVDKNIRNSSGPNYTYPQRIYPVCASSTYAFPGQIEGGNIVDSYGDINNIGCVFGNEYTSFTDETVPSAKTILEYSNGSVTSATETGKPLTHIVNQDGIVTFRFDNPNFKIQQYHEDDKEGLRQFLRQPSAMINKLNLELLGISVTDTVNWYISEDWVNKINTSQPYTSVQWNEESPRRIQVIFLSTVDKISGFLDCSRFTKLESLVNNGTSIYQLDISKNKELTTLACFSYDKITQLDVSNNLKLKDLRFYGYGLTELDVTNNEALVILHCNASRLSKLDLTKNLLLEVLDLAGNLNLKEIDISNNKKLKSFDCHFDKLKMLDVSENKELEYLDCSDNELTRLDISSNTNLIALRCYNNYMTFSGLPIFNLGSSEQLPYGYAYSYSPQKPIWAENPSNQIIDLSSEYNINGNITTYYWFDGEVTPLYSADGKFIAKNDQTYSVACTMKNATFPDLTIQYRIVKTSSIPIELKDHLKVNIENIHSINKNQTFQIYANTNIANPDELRFGLYNPTNGDLRDSLIVVSKTNNVFTCQLRSQTNYGSYMLMPYTYELGERKDIERSASSPWIDKLPIKVNEDIWGRSLTSYVPSEDVSANKYIQLNINNKVNELFEIDQFVPFKVYMPTTAPAEARIGLFYPNGTFYTDITNTRSTYTYTCEITDEVQDGNYIIMPYIKHEGKIKVVERTTGSKLMDRLPVKVNEVDIWGDDIWADTSLKVAFSEGADKNTSVSVVFEKASDILSIYAPTEVIQSEIYNMQGVLVKKVNQDSRFSLNNLHTGVYIVKVTTPQGISTHKIKKD